MVKLPEFDPGNNTWHPAGAGSASGEYDYTSKKMSRN